MTSAWAAPGKGVSRGFFSFIYNRKVSGIGDDGGGVGGVGGGGGGGGSFAAIELIDHLLFPAFFKEVNV